MRLFVSCSISKSNSSQDLFSLFKVEIYQNKLDNWTFSAEKKINWNKIEFFIPMMKM